MQQIGMGVEFRDLSPLQLMALECFVADKPLPDNASVDESPGLAPSLPPPPEPLHRAAAGFNGRFSMVSPADVLQVIEHGQLSGSLVVQMGDTSGEVWFKAGRIVNAHYQDLTPRRALEALLGAADGSFEFNPSPSDGTEAVHSPADTQRLVEQVGLPDEHRVQ
jgi:hypothetical protein